MPTFDEVFGDQEKADREEALNALADIQFKFNVGATLAALIDCVLTTDEPRRHRDRLQLLSDHWVDFIAKCQPVLAIGKRVVEEELDDATRDRLLDELRELIGQ